MSERDGMSMCRRCGTWVPFWSACACGATNPDKTDRYAEGIAEGRRQAFAEAAEIARARQQELLRPARPSGYSIACAGEAEHVAELIEAAAKGGKG